MRGKPRPTKPSCSMQLMMLTIMTMTNGNQISGGEFGDDANHDDDTDDGDDDDDDDDIDVDFGDNGW